MKEDRGVGIDLDKLPTLKNDNNYTNIKHQC